jgi:hypothetical protein
LKKVARELKSDSINLSNLALLVKRGMGIRHFASLPSRKIHSNLDQGINKGAKDSTIL